MTLELTDLEAMLLSICSNLNRPIRKSQLTKMVTELFECNNQKQVDFAILDLIEQEQLVEYKHFIVTPDFYATWDKNITAQDEGIIKYLLSLKEEAKHDIFFNVYAPEPLTPSTFFKYINMVYPELLHREDTALAYMNYFDSVLAYGLNNSFYAEKNDYPANHWFSTFFDNPDCKNIDLHKSHVCLSVILLPGKTRNYSMAKEQLQELEEHIKNYFELHMIIHTKSKPLSMLTGDTRRKHSGGK